MSAPSTVVLRYGERSLLVETGDATAVLALARSLRVEPVAGVAELVPARTSLLVHLADRADPQVVGAALATRRPAPVGPATGERVEIPVVYDGPDLTEVAARTGLSAAEVVALHSGGDLTVAFCGFAPGFAYLSGLPPELTVPRRREPRTRVPAGAVGLAGDLSGIYPRVSPGGWQLIGRTDVVLWDLRRDPPALLRPGLRVRFVPA